MHRFKIVLVTFVAIVIIVLSAIVINRDRPEELSVMSTQGQIEDIDNIINSIDEFILKLTEEQEDAQK